MRIDMKGRTLRRAPDDIDYAGLTTATKTGPASWVPGQLDLLEIPFASEPTAAEAAAIIDRLTSENSTEEVIRNQARALYSDLRKIRGSTGTLSNALLSDAVRTLAKGQILLMRLMLREFDGTD